MNGEPTAEEREKIGSAIPQYQFSRKTSCNRVLVRFISSDEPMPNS
jgi:hypothetical protein